MVTNVDKLWINNKLNLNKNQIEQLTKCKTIEDELTLLFLFSKEKGWIKYDRVQGKSDGLLGNVFEDLIGIKENNKKEPDYGGFEIKTKNVGSKSNITMFNKSINSIKSANTTLKNEYGIKEENSYVNVLNTTVKYYEWNSHRGGHNFKLDLDEDLGKLYLRIKDSNTDTEIDNNRFFWEINTINNQFKKIKNCCVIEGKINTKEKLVKFTKMTIYKNASMPKFWNIFKDKYIFIDFRIGEYKSGPRKGKTHDHGTAFRIKESKLTDIFDFKKIIE